MDVSRLTKDELLHEVGIRGAKRKPSESTSKELRSLFKTLRDSEAAGEEQEDALLPVNVSEEISIIQAKLDDATQLLDGLAPDDEKVNKSDAGRIRTVTSHCNHRLQRLLSHTEGAERSVVKPLFVTLKGLVEEFRKRGAAPVYAASSVPSVSSVTPSKKPDGDGSDEERDSDGPKSSRKSRVPRDLHKWGIRFSGEDDSSVLSFILDVEEKAAWRGVELDHLLVGVSEFFFGEAKTWYRSVRDKVDSWEELKIALRREYLPLDYYDNLWEEIRGRKQGINESVGTFIANMTAMFARLGMEEPIAEDIRLKIILKNLAPYYTERLALTDVLSVKHLKVLGKQLEVSKMRVDSYDLKNKVKKMEPEFAVKSSRQKKPSVAEVSVETPKVVEVSEATVNQPASASKPKAYNPKITCWKCDKVGHRHSDCDSEAKRVFCYKCGMKDVTVRNCPRCRRKGEGQ